MKPELIVPLDVDSLDKALELRDQLVDVVDFFKVGKELFTALGRRFSTSSLELEFFST